MLYNFLILLSGYAMLSGEPDRTYIPSAVDNVVFIETSEGRCSGTVIAVDLVVTAAHCVPKDGNAGAMLDNGQFRKLKVVYTGVPGTRWDVALFKGDLSGVKPAPIADSFPELPEAAFAFGFAGTHTEMMFPAFLVQDAGFFGILGKAEVRPGDSGGGVFGKRDELIGVIWGGNLADPFDVIIAPIDSVHEALRAIGREPMPQ